MTMTSALDLVDGHPFLSDLSPAQRRRLSAWARRAAFQAGRTIFTDGAPATRFWLIREGAVELTVTLPDGSTAVVETLGPGAPLGWSWLFPPYRWHFTGIAVAPTLTVEFDAAGVRRLCDEDPALGYALTRRVSAVLMERLRATTMRLAGHLPPSG